MQILNAVGYIRFSSALQEQGSSVTRQQTLINRWVDNNPNVTLYGTYSDLGKSAWDGSKHDEREALLKLLSDTSIPKPCYLLTEDASRLSRLDFNLAVKQMNQLHDLGFTVVFLSTGKTYDSSSFLNLGDHISFLVEAETHNKASEQKSHHSRSNWKRLREDAALTGKLISRSCARWVNPVETGTGEPNQNGRRTTFIYNEHAETVRLIYQMRLSGASMNNIAQTLNDQSVRTLTGKLHTWNQTSVNGILNNRAVIGDYVPSRNTAVNDAETITGYYPQLISPSDFQTIQNMRNGSGRVPVSDNPTNINLFKSILKCRCGGAIISASVTPERYGYYVCSLYRLKRCTEFAEQRPEGGRGKGIRGKGNSIPRKLVDDNLLNGFLYCLPLLLSGSNSDNHQLQKLEAELQIIESELTNLEDNMSRLKLSERLVKRYQEKDSESEVKKQEIAELRKRMLTSVNVETVSDLDMSNRQDRSELNLIAKKYIHEIRLDMKNKTCDITLHNGFKFFRYPLDRPGFDGASWVHFFLMINEKEYIFDAALPSSSGLPGQIENYPVVTKQASHVQTCSDWPEADEPDYPNTSE